MGWRIGERSVLTQIGAYPAAGACSKRGPPGHGSDPVMQPQASTIVSTGSHRACIPRADTLRSRFLRTMCLQRKYSESTELRQAGITARPELPQAVNYEIRSAGGRLLVEP